MTGRKFASIIVIVNLLLMFSKTDLTRLIFSDYLKRQRMFDSDKQNARLC